MRLKPPLIGQLLQTIEDSFDPFAMDRLLQVRFGLRLHNVTAVYKDFRTQAVDIHNYFDQRNRTEELIAVLHDARPAVAELATLSDHAGFAQLPPPASLEVLVRRDGRAHQDVTLFRGDLAKREVAVCRIDTPNGHGTGSLVGPDLVLTNYHVIADTLDHGGNFTAGSTACLFDHKQDAAGYATPELRVGVTGIVASSPYAPEDLGAQGANEDTSKLDYALLRLERPVGNESIVEGGEKRGFLAIPASPRSAGLTEGLIILQHPMAKPMKIDIGAVTWAGTTRLRHSVNTEGGSSGSPIFDAALNLVAIHHAGYDWPKTEFPYNQGIPLALIITDARSRGAGI